MKCLFFVPLLLAASAIANPINSEEDLVVTREFFLDTDVKYTSQHDIVNVVVPLNSINFDDDADENDDSDCQDVAVFFAEADVNDKGERIDQGLYILKKDKVSKILANGRDAAAFNDDSKKVYLGASDGIYVYDGTNGTTTKYGSLTDSIVQIEADNQTGIIYFLTDNHKVFSVADGGTKKNKVNVDDVKEFVFDFNSNMYYYDTKKDIYVFNQAGVKQIEGIPKSSDVKLVRPMFVQEREVLAVVDGILYLLNANGSASTSGITFQVKPTAYAPEATLIHYYAWNKKLYEFNAIKIIASKLLSELAKFLEDKTNEIQTIATRSRSSFGAQK